MVLTKKMFDQDYRQIDGGHWPDLIIINHSYPRHLQNVTEHY